MTQSLSQERAKHALLKINTLKTNGNYGRYVSYVSALPASILTNGLGQAMAQLLAQVDKKKGANDPHYILHHHVENWLCQKRKIFNRTDNGRVTHQSNLVQGIVEGDQKMYLLAQAEALAYLEWLKKFARAFLEKQEGGSDHANRDSTL